MENTSGEMTQLDNTGKQDRSRPNAFMQISGKNQFSKGSGKSCCCSAIFSKLRVHSILFKFQNNTLSLILLSKWTTFLNSTYLKIVEKLTFQKMKKFRFFHYRTTLKSETIYYILQLNTISENCQSYCRILTFSPSFSM